MHKKEYDGDQNENFAASQSETQHPDSALAQHEAFMQEALLLARKGAGCVHPNPLVGAVLVRDGKIIGRGWHERCGEAHAEVNAVKDARAHGFENLVGTTIYVTLEPCCHSGRTPPCTDLIISTGIGTVVTGMTDPNPLVSGKGLASLQKAGIKVLSGVLNDECRALNRIFIKYITSHRPFVLLKSACSMDGKIATASGESKWISCEESRQDVHRLRGEYTAVMCGIDTVIADDPMLNVRAGEKNHAANPVRIVVDSHLRIPLQSRIVKTAHEIPTIIATTTSGENRALADAGISILHCDEKNGRVDLRWLMEKLGQMEIDSILLEGGGTLAFSALQEEILDCVRFYIAPILIGGTNAKGVVGGNGIERLAEAYRLTNLHIDKSGCDIVVEGDICSRE